MSFPRQIGAYDVIEELGRGSMGVVFRVRKGEVQRDLALKVIASAKLSNATARERFRREAKLLAKIRHPGVIRVHDAGEEQGVLWYAMDIVDGESLEDRINTSGPLPEREACELMRKIADAVAAIHDEGIVHRDLKPLNVLLGKDTNEPLIADFGLARELESEEQRLTRTGFSVGTPSYMSPEQIRAQKDVDSRSDVYALGAIFHFVLTGREPFVTTTLEELVRQVLDVAAKPPSAAGAKTSIHVDRLTLHALAKDRALRPKDARAFANELAAIPAGAAAAATRQRPTFFVPLVVLILGAATAFGFHYLERSSIDKLLASQEATRRAGQLEAARLAEQNAQRVQNLIVSVRAHMAEGDDDEALRGAQEALRRAPNDPVVLAIYAQALIPSFYTKKPDAADRRARSEAAVIKALRLAPDHPGVLLAQARLVSFERGKERAPLRPLLKDVLDRGDRRDRLAAVSLWILAVGPEELEPLLAIVDTCVKEAPSWAHAHFVRGQVLDELRRYEDAVKAYDRCLELAPNMPIARRDRALDRERLDDWKGAREDWTKLLERWPDNSEVHFQLGMACEHLSDNEAALRHYDIAIERWGKGYNPVYGRRGRLLATLGLHERAIPDLEKAIDPYAMLQDVKALAVCCTKAGKNTRAQELWLKAVALDGQNPETVLAAGAFIEQVHPPEESLRFYRSSLERVKPEARAPIDARLEAAKAKLKKLRADEQQRRLDVCKAELAFVRAMPLESPFFAEVKARSDALQRRLNELEAYQKETRKLLDGP